MRKLLQRKFVWLALLVVWVGMIISISNHRNKSTAFETLADQISIQADEPLVQKSDSLVVAGSAADDFFASFRFEREHARSESMSILNDLIENPQTEKGIQKQAQEKIIELTGRIEKEMEIESLVKARGYAEALAFLHDEAVDIIIQTKGLERDDVARIGDVVAKATGLNFANITIIEKKMAEKK